MKRRSVLLSVVSFWVLGATNVQAQLIVVDVYRDFYNSGTGAPYSGYVRSFNATDVLFASSTGGNWHPEGLEAFGAEISGTLGVANSGTYEFVLRSADGSALTIDGKQAVSNNAGTCGFPQILTARNKVFLTAGRHPFEIEFYSDGSGPSGVDLILPDGVVYARGEYYTLTVSAGAGGTVTSPGVGAFQYDAGSIVAIEAAPVDANHVFVAWTGSAVENDKVGSPTSRQTWVLVDGHYSLTATFAKGKAKPQSGEGGGVLDFDDPAEFAFEVDTNNDDAPLIVYVERVIGLSPDPNGMMRMQVIGGQSARAKGHFAKCDAERVLVRFQYLFASIEPAEILVFLSDVPDLLSPGHPRRAQHYTQIGRVLIPPAGRPGAMLSNRFGVFEVWVPVGQLNFSKGLWVELELRRLAPSVSTQIYGGQLTIAGPSDGTALLDNLAVEIHCDGICMDLNWSDTVDEDDFLLVIASTGTITALDKNDPNDPDHHCLEGAFSSDGYIDLFDTQSWTWAMGDLSRVVCNYCRVPLPLVGPGLLGMAGIDMPGFPEPSYPAGFQIQAGAVPLLLLGKTRVTNALSDLLSDSLYQFDDGPAYLAKYAVTGSLPSRCGSQITRGPADDLYLVNADRGVLRIDGKVQTIVPPGKTYLEDEPRYRREATVYVGIQGQGTNSFGRPILDAAMGPHGRMYVVPVVVQPTGKNTYLAAAQLELDPELSPPYRVAMLYDDPCLPNDNQRRHHLREIEVDRAGNVYLLNVHRLNESCILWRYGPGDTLQRRWRRDLTGPDGVSKTLDQYLVPTVVKVDDPIALHVAHDGQTIYMASGQGNAKDPANALVYGLSTENGSLVRTIKIKGMQLVTSITEAPATGTLWVTGFSMPEILDRRRQPDAQPYVPDPFEPFYVPFLAEVPRDTNVVTAVCIADPARHKLALPTSVLWTGPRK
ncbi:MAG: PA14 domain-containing protein [Planctomycetes bacterium]|jgi:hypothetical protein|nr:PA14 domain-containing protein [Planctomycetota bacterium]